MRIRSAETLQLKSSDEPTPTIEIDLGSIPEGESLQSLLRDALSVTADEQQISTLRIYFTQSINFHEPTSSAFVMAIGGRSVLEHIHDELQAVSGLRMRYSDYVVASRGMPLVHLEEGTLWLPLDVQNWYADAELVISDLVSEQDDAGDSDLEEEEESEANDDVWLAPLDQSEGATTRSRGQAVLRTRAARADASIGSIARTIERMLSLPEGSVLLCGPDKRALRRDARIGTLRRRWE